MPRFELSVEITRPPDDVFAYLTDVSKLPEWQSSALSAVADGPMGEGTTIRERRRFAGREVRSELEVVTYEPSRRFDVESRGGPVSFAIRHLLEPAGDGTNLSVEVDVRLSGLLRLAAQGPLKLAEREFEADFARLKEILEKRA